jgi:hypothetical protein
MSKFNVSDQDMKRDSDVRVYIDNEFVSLRYHVRQRVVHHEFKQFVRGEHFRGVLEKGLEVFRRYGAYKWLSDDRGNTAITPADSEWAVTDWAPRVIAAGWRFWAVVLPENTIGQMNMRRWLKTYAEKGVTADAFSDPAVAFDWLENQK